MSCGNEYIVGDLVTLTVNVTSKATGQPANATTVTAKVQTPSGEVDDITPGVVNPTVGTYTVDYAPSEEGQYLYEFIGQGSAVFATVSKFFVNRTTF